MSDKKHWEGIYEHKSSKEVSWYRPHLNVSLDLIHETGLNRDARLIDVGGGASTLVDDLLDLGYANVTVLDISTAALEVAKARLGVRSTKACWIEASVLDYKFDANSYDLWHDRAVFHFLTASEDQERYVDQVTIAVRPAGFLVIGAFAQDGPTKCSGLNVVRYSAQDLAGRFGDAFTLLRSRHELHQTPSGGIQSFAYALMQRRAP